MRVENPALHTPPHFRPPHASRPAHECATRSSRRPTGQVLVLFVLFLLVLLGVSALAIDYASWLLTDRDLQNTADHAALAGAAEFGPHDPGQLPGGAGQQKCIDARAQAWTSLEQRARPRSLDDARRLPRRRRSAGGNTPRRRDDSARRTTAASCRLQGNGSGSRPRRRTTRRTPRRIGGRYALNYGVVWVRVDRAVRSFLGGALGISPQPRHGWATAGALPTDFALQIFCRITSRRQSGVCVNSAALTIDGQGGIRLLRGDIGSNESLTVTSNGGEGVIHRGQHVPRQRCCCAEHVELPERPAVGRRHLRRTPPSYNGKNAFYIAPLPVPSSRRRSTWSATAHGTAPPRRRPACACPTRPGQWEPDGTGRLDLPHERRRQPMRHADRDERAGHLHRPGRGPAAAALLPDQRASGRAISRAIRHLPSRTATSTGTSTTTSRTAISIHRPPANPPTDFA